MIWPHEVSNMNNFIGDVKVVIMYVEINISSRIGYIFKR